MMANYAQHVSTKNTPQNQPIRGKDQVKNEAGGYVFQVTWQTRLRRFLILGNEGGSYYATERQRVVETVDCIDEGLSDNWEAVVDMIVDVSTNGRAPKNDHAVFALAYVAGKVGHPAAAYALSKLNDVCRIGTHLFAFCEAVQHFRGWGRGLRDTVSGWYTGREPLALARQVTKYKQRNGWSHRDVLRKAHPRTDGLHNEVLQYVTQPEKWRNATHKMSAETTDFLHIVETAKVCTKPVLIKLIQEYGLVREHLPTEMLNDVGVWDALLENMPLTAMIRNLGKMSSIGLLKPLASRVNHVVAALTDPEKIKQARVHPLNALIAFRQYEKGEGLKGKLSWTPVSQIVDALVEMFYLGFDAVEPTGKNFLLGVDVSGSMSWTQCAGAPITCWEAAVVMAMVAARTEPNTHILGFCDRPVELGITAKDTLASAAEKAQKDNFGSTDCAAVMQWAIDHDIDVDCFCIYTDGQTWAGSEHPVQALQRYRHETGRPAKLAAFQMEGNSFSIADPADAGMMDFSGFDTSVPPILADFVLQ